MPWPEFWDTVLWGLAFAQRFILYLLLATRRKMIKKGERYNELIDEYKDTMDEYGSVLMEYEKEVRRLKREDSPVKVKPPSKPSMA